MKNIQYIFALAIGVLFVSGSCSKQMDETGADIINGDNSGERVSLTFTACLPEGQFSTRSINPSTGVVSWSAGDVIYIIDGYSDVDNRHPHTLTSEEINGNVATFKVDDLEKADKYYAVYLQNLEDYSFVLDEENNEILFDPRGGGHDTELNSVPYIAFAQSDAQMNFSFKNVLSYFKLKVNEKYANYWMALWDHREEYDSYGWRAISFQDDELVFTKPANSSYQHGDGCFDLKIPESGYMYFPFNSYYKSKEGNDFQIDIYYNNSDNYLACMEIDLPEDFQKSGSIIDLGDITYRLNDNIIELYGKEGWLQLKNTVEAGRDDFADKTIRIHGINELWIELGAINDARGCLDGATLDFCNETICPEVCEGDNAILFNTLNSNGVCIQNLTIDHSYMDDVGGISLIRSQGNYGIIIGTYNGGGELIFENCNIIWHSGLSIHQPGDYRFGCLIGKVAANNYSNIFISECSISITVGSDTGSKVGSYFGEIVGTDEGAYVNFNNCSMEGCRIGSQVYTGDAAAKVGLFVGELNSVHFEAGGCVISSCEVAVVWANNYYTYDNGERTTFLIGSKGNDENYVGVENHTEDVYPFEQFPSKDS